MTDFLVLKSGTYYVRLDVPEDAREAFSGRKVLTKSLKTGNRSEAHIFKQRSEGWKPLVKPVESAPPSEALWISSLEPSGDNPFILV